MSLVSNIQDVAYSSSAPTDKIVGIYSGSFNTATAPLLGGYLPYTSISHSFTRPVLCKSMFSTDGSVWHDENTEGVQGLAYSTTSSIVVVANATGVIYYRVVATWIDNFDTSDPLIGETIGSNSEVYFDSRLNYQKIFSQGSIDVPASPIITLPVTHNLGYAPNVRAYNEARPGEIWPCTYGGLKNIWVYDFDFIEVDARIYSDRVDFAVGGGFSSPASKIWYVIYYDN